MVRLPSLVLMSALGVACGQSSTAPSTPTNLTGSWAGLLGESRTGTSLRVTWSATQSGKTVSGPATLIKPNANFPANGTMSGTLSGSQLSLTYTAAAGTTPGFPSCSISGTGSATASGTSISGTLTITPQSCDGSGLERPSSNLLELTK